MKEIIKGDIILYANNTYEVAYVKDFPHGKMIGIYDEKNSEHIDYLNPNNVQKVSICSNCQNGCTTCNGFRYLIN